MGYFININELCIPQEPEQFWLDYLIENYYFDEAGNLFKYGRIKPIGYFDRDGYLVTRLGPIKGLTEGKRHFRISHIIWYLEWKIWPVSEIDHIDRCRSNNRVNNLRLISREENLRRRFGEKIVDPF